MSNLEIYKNINFSNDLELPVTLSNYIITNNKDTKEKHVVLRLFNNYHEVPTNLEIEVTELDNLSNIVRVSSYELFSFNNSNTINKLDVNNKFVLENNTSSITTRLISVNYSNNSWSNNTWLNYYDTTNNIDSNNITEDVLNTKTLEIKEVQVKLSRFPFLVPITLVVLAVLLVFLNFNVFYENNNYNTKDMFEYINSGNGVTITGYNRMLEDVVIPEQIDGKDVIKIADYAFSDSSIKSIVIRSEKIDIGIGAFYNAKKLRSVEGRNIGVVYYDAFYNNTNLRLFSFNSVDEVYAYAFVNTKRLNRLDIVMVHETTFRPFALDGTKFKDTYTK